MGCRVQCVGEELRVYARDLLAHVRGEERLPEVSRVHVHLIRLRKLQIDLDLSQKFFESKNRF